MVMKTKNLKANPFDEAEKANPFDVAERPDFGMIVIPKEEPPGVWKFNRQLDQLLGSDEYSLEDLLPWDAKYDFGRIVGMTEKPDETKDKMASSLYYSIELGQPPELTFNILDELNRIAFDKQIPASTAWGRIKQRYQTGKAQVQMMDLGYDLLNKSWRDPESYEKSIKNIEKLQSGMTDDVRKEFRGFFEKVLGATSEQIPIMWQAAKEAPKGALIGGFMGGIIAAIGGMAVPAPEEVVTVPAGAMTGIKVGGGVLAANRIRQLEAGGMFLELMQMEDQYGNKIDPRTAIVASHAVGAINGAIELAEWQVLLSTFGIGKRLFDSSVAKVTNKIFAEGTLKRVVAKNIARYGIALSAETMQEIEQETTNIVFGELAKELNDARKGTDFKPISADDLKSRYHEVTVESLRAFGLLVAPGTTISTVIDTITKKAAKEKAAKTGVVEVKVPETAAEISDEELFTKFRETKVTSPEWKPLYDEVMKRREQAKKFEAEVTEMESELSEIQKGAMAEAAAPTVAPEAAREAKVEKQPWEMTLDEYRKEYAYVPIMFTNEAQKRGPTFDISLNIPKSIREIEHLPMAEVEIEPETKRTLVKFRNMVSLQDAKEELDEIITSTEGRDWDAHRLAVENAVKEGRKVDPKIAKEYKGWNWADKYLEEYKSEPEAKVEKTIAEKEDSVLLERWSELDAIAKAKRKPQEIAELKQIEDELIKRHPQEKVEKDISDKNRRRIIKETEEEIKSYELYQNALQTIEEQEQALPPIKYIVARTKDKIPGEIKDYIGKPGTKGYKGYLWQHLTTYEENPNATGWDEALEQAGGRPGDIGEFIERLDAVIQQTKGKGVISQQALDIAIGQGDMYAEIISLKYNMLKDGFSAEEINKSIREIGQVEGIDPELLERYNVPVEEVKYVGRTKKEILRGLLKESQKAKRKAKRPSLEEAAVKKATDLAHKTKEPHYVYEKTGKDAGLYAVSKHPPAEGVYKKITPPKEGEIRGEVTEEYAGLTPEEKASARKLRQKIHAVAVNKGLTKKALTELKKKHTGYQKLTGQRAIKNITTEQLQNLLKAVQKARPKRIGPKKVITLKTEKKIQTLRDSLKDKLQMTDEAYENILDKIIGGKEPKYVSGKHFITEKEGKEIIKSMNNAAEIIRATEGFEKAIRENADIAKEVKRLDEIISKQKKRDPYTLESMRYYCQQCEIKTGVPIFTMYMDLIDTHLETSKTRTAILKGLEATVGKAEFRKISRDEQAKQRIVEYIASQSRLYHKPPVPEKITASEKKIAQRIVQIFKDKEVEVRFTKFYWWYVTGRQEGSFPMADYDKYKTEINKAVDIYEGRGKDELIEYLKTQEWGIIKSGYEPLEHITNKIKLYLPKSTTVGKSHIQVRTDIEYHTQERDIFQRLAAYLRQMDMLYNLSPKINAFVQLFEDNMNKFNNPKNVQQSIEAFLRNLKRYNIQGGFFERLIARMYSQAMRTIIMPSPVLAYRNLFQNAAFEHDKSILIDTRNKSLTAEEVEYIETYVQQVRGMVEEYFMVGEKPLPGLKTLSDLIEYVKVYPTSDVANRFWSFWAKINQVHRALKNENLKAMMKEARFDDMKELEQRRALGILARDGKEAMAMYVSRVHVDDIHFLYERAQRSPAEMTTLGRTAGSLMLFPRSYGEKLAHAANKTINGKSYNEQWRGLKILFSVIGGGMAVGTIFTLTTGRKRNPYNPLQILSYQPGGLAFGAIAQFGKVIGDTLLSLSGNEKAAYRLTSEIPDMADMFVPFYAYVMRGFEALTDQKNVDSRELRKIYAMIDKEYKIRGGAYKVRRNALEKWQYFLAGAGVDQKEEKKGKTIKR